MLIELKDVSIRVKNRNEKGKKVGEHILSNVCGEIRAGFTAVIGPSGCGKTTLLRTILGKMPSEYISSGEISYCGRKRVLDEWTRMTTYLDQCDSVSAFLTAKECLYYAAVFSSKYTKSVIYEKIEEIAKKLCLKNVLNCAMVNLSGGQVKRVKIALELIIDVPIILLDEPTTGVDNVLAYRIIEFLKEIAGHNKIVVCSIHQPDDRTLMLFDRVILMNWGRIVYNGAVDNIARTIAENGFLNIDNLEISTYVLDFLNTSRVKYVDPSEHCQIVNNMVSKYLLTCRKHKRKYIERKSNEFYLRFAPCFNHIITLCKRDLKITFKSLRLQIPLLILYNLPLLALPFVPLNLYRGITNETVRKTEKQILDLEKPLINLIQSSLCFFLSNVTLSINQYKAKTDFLAVKEINRHAYTITSYYISTMLLSITYFLPVFILDLVLFRVLSRDLFDNMSLVLITLFFFSTIFFLNFVLDASENYVLQYMLMMISIVLNSYPWIMSHFITDIKTKWLKTAISILLHIFPASTFFPFIILRIYERRITRLRSSDINASIRARIYTKIANNIRTGILLIPDQCYISYSLMVCFLVVYLTLSYFVTIRPFCFESRVDLSKKVIAEDEDEKVRVRVVKND